MPLAQLSPAVIVGTPTNLNPLAQANNSATAAVVGTIAQKNTQKAKSDSVTISREAMAKAAEADARNGSGKDAQTKDATPRAKPR
ncbi:hypothetical protein F6V30_15110 [Oryzomonas sagensis]|uniref:Uncharacterized protein n=1 Tax=Oryzomonas sagensis TaxID=2603857 RepID=A0ABQ6TL21_9BACT|nr:hypothetical protein [Oryzomonas sagensis]KAB0668834.1 hypothetical protein F6V30_15110 [Oryzomonas sagensis]